jgi:hypothetical protein
MNRIVKVIGIVVMVGLVAGCAGEKRLETSGAGTPEWINRPTRVTEDTVSFMGIALMRNMLDQRSARNRALSDARRQIAESMSTEVDASSVQIDFSEGAAHMGEDEQDASFRQRLQTQARAAVRGARETEYYWEKWKIDPGLFSRAYTRYKYYVHVEVPRDLYDRLLSDLQQD